MPSLDSNSTDFPPAGEIATLRAAFKEFLMSLCRTGVTGTIYNTATVCVGVNLFNEKGIGATTGTSSRPWSLLSDLYQSCSSLQLEQPLQTLLLHPQPPY